MENSNRVWKASNRTALRGALGNKECSVGDWSGGNHDRWEQKNDEGLSRLCCHGQSPEMLNEEETGL